jgi:hypothetical protein
VEEERHPINLKEKRVVFDLHSVLSHTSRKRRRGRPLEGVVRGGKRHWWAWEIP